MEVPPQQLPAPAHLAGSGFSAAQTIQRERVSRLNRRPLRKAKYILLWVQQDVRSLYNHALEHAVKLANQMQLPVVACYGLWERFPEANERCFAFLLDGLQDLHEALHARGVPLVVLREPPPDAALRMCSNAAGLVCDAG
mmetsp:Transcript_22958/g.63728  ORF Transcript_22958/g.63728 Transcript_22958/m.63728 type:complete len:140 (-) Transcript_22958:2091-2510(-)